MGIVRTLRYLVNHPLNRPRKVAALKGFFKWHIGSRIVPGPVLVDWVAGSKMAVRPGDHGLTSNVYCGLHEFEDMSYLLHLTSPDDLFVDVGANAGSYTILACKARGAKGLCFEPVPSIFKVLEENLHVNELAGRVEAFNLGISDKDGQLRFTSTASCENHVVSEDENPPHPIEVEVKSLDSILNNGRCPSILKIDVEGYEARVIDGAERLLQNPALHSVIMELRGHGARYGFDEDALLQKMLDHGFATRSYDPFQRELKCLSGRNSLVGNTLFTRNEDLIKSKLETAEPIKIFSSTI